MFVAQPYGNSLSLFGVDEFSAHKGIVQEFHAFFLASQHPSASPALSRLAAKYSMPAQM
jgi:hypothetical protein